MDVFNLLDGDLEPGWHDRPGFEWRYASVGQRVGGALIGMSLYELSPGQTTFPYHYELGREEWLIVVSGRPTLRAPDGERALRAGDVVCFPEGPGGAHQVRNDAEEPAQVAILSTKPSMAVAIYPDSGKIGVWGAERHMVRGEPELDYWDRRERSRHEVGAQPAQTRAGFGGSVGPERGWRCDPTLWVGAARTKRP